MPRTLPPARRRPRRPQPRLEWLEGRTLLATFVVTTTADAGPGSLRQAILDSNASATTQNTIAFDLPAPAGPSLTGRTITVASSLPPVTRPVLIDGFSQPGYAGLPLVEVRADSKLKTKAVAVGLDVATSGVTIRGLAVTDFRFGTGIRITGPNATGDWVYASHLGVDPTGLVSRPNGISVLIEQGASANRIGTNGDGVDDAAERNVMVGISGAVRIVRPTWPGSAGTSGNVVVGNLIGVNVTATGPLVGNNYGVVIDSDSNWVGTDPGVGTSGPRLGNTFYAGRGVVLNGDRNVVQGNGFGTDPGGRRLFPSMAVGVSVTGNDNLIGGLQPGEGNLIFGAGVSVEFRALGGRPATGNRLVGNTIRGGPVAVAGSGNSVRLNEISHGSYAPAIDLGNNGVTYNAPAPRTFPDRGNLPNFPTLVVDEAGAWRGWLGGSLPNATFLVDVYAGARFLPSGSGEAEVPLGTLEVTTDAAGQALFDVPFTPPPGRPLLTATATDPHGTTSELSAVRRTALVVPGTFVKVAPDTPLVLSAARGNGIALSDQDAGPTVPAWDLTLEVSSGSVALRDSTGLVGTGDGTASLRYRGSLADLNAALDGLTFRPAPGPHSFATVRVEARSVGTNPVSAEFSITDDPFIVWSTADAGAGSLRQAILNAKTSPGPVAVRFDIPGAGPHTIAVDTPLPEITGPLVLDGATQPGYGGTPTVAVRSNGNHAALTIGAAVTLRSVGFDTFATTRSVRLSVTPQPPKCGASRIVLGDVRGQTLVQTDGTAGTGGESRLDLYLDPGRYSLRGQSREGATPLALSVEWTPGLAPLQPQGFDVSGLNVWASTSGDFDGDGSVDLAAVGTDGFGVAYLSVAHGFGDGAFASPVRYPLVNDPSWGSNQIPVSVSAGDLNCDGRLDALVGYKSDKEGLVGVLLNRGDGTFAPVVAYRAGDALSSVAVADFNGDRFLDLAVSNGEAPGFSLTQVGGTDNGRLSVLLGNGDGTLAPAVAYDFGLNLDAVTADDFDRDGVADLGFVDLGPRAAKAVRAGVLLGNGDGTFRPGPVRLIRQGSPDADAGVAAGDFDADGRLDLAVSDWGASTVTVLAGLGDGDLGARTDFEQGFQVRTVQALDLNRDGVTDLAVLGDGGAVQFFGRPGRGLRFGAYQSLGNGFFLSQAAGDFDGDGWPDLYLGSERLLMGRGDGTFQAVDESAATRPYLAIDPNLSLLGDFNGDGRPDHAWISGTLSVAVSLGNGDGSFRAPLGTQPTGPEPAAIVAADFNGDGRLDLAVTYQRNRNGSGVGVDDGGVNVFLGNGDGTLQPPLSFEVGFNPTQLFAADLNGDGNADLAAQTVPGFQGPRVDNVLVYLSTGDGTFRLASTFRNYVTNGYSADYRTLEADFNGDGFPDLILMNVFELTVYLNDGHGGFRPLNPIPPPSDSTFSAFRSVDFTAADFDGDGRIDLLGGRDVPGTLLYLGVGDGTFRKGIRLTEFNGFKTVRDFDGDGRPDLLDLGHASIQIDANTSGDAVGLYFSRGNGDGTFQPAILKVLRPGSPGSTGLLSGDLNSDGIPDVLTENDVLLGNGDGTFTSAGRLALNTRGIPLVADVDADGAADVLVVDADGRVLLRRGVPGRPGVVQPPVPVDPGTAARDVAWLEGAGLLAVVDAHSDGVRLYTWRGGSFQRVGVLTTDRYPAQAVAADLDGDGKDELIVRNAGSGTLSVYRRVGPAPAGSHGLLSRTDVPVGETVSDVAARDVDGDGRVDLLLASKASGRVGVLRGLGYGEFAPPAWYRAGVSPTAAKGLDGGGATVVSAEATVGVAAGRFVAGAPVSLVTAGAGTRALHVLAGLGAGRFADPQRLSYRADVRAVRSADLNGDGVDDLAALGADGLDVLLADGRGGFLPATRYPAGLTPDGLTVRDFDWDGRLDLLVGNAYGDVLVLLGRGDGTFAPYRKADQAVALAVADLDGDGKPEFIYANQSLDRVSVQYGGQRTSVLGDRNEGLLSPGAVTLADLNGDSVADLVVANSGSNNVLVYPGTGGGRFGQALNGGRGFYTGTNPTAVAVTDLNGDGRPDLVVANTGSNDVSVLLGQGGGSDWTMARGPRIRTDAGPAAVTVGDVLGAGALDLAVANRQAGTVQVFPGVGNGFFNDQSPRTFPAGSAPGGLFLGNFTGQGNQLAVLDGGASTVNLVGQGQSLPTGGVRPTAGFAGDFNGDGFTDLVVANGGSGTFSLLFGGSAGLALSQTLASPAVPSPTAMSFAGVSDGVLSFYAATAGREAVSLLSFDLNRQDPTGAPVLPGPSTPSEPPPGGASVFRSVVQLLGNAGSALTLVAAVFTVTAAPGDADAEFKSNRGVELLANFLPSLAQDGLGPPGESTGCGSEDGPQDPPGREKPPGDEPNEVEEQLPPWEQLAMGLDESWEAARAGVLEADPLAPPRALTEADPTPSPLAGRASSLAAPPAAHASFRVHDVALDALSEADAPPASSANPGDEPSADETTDGPDYGLAVAVLATTAVATAARRRWSRRNRPGGPTIMATSLPGPGA